MNYKRITSSYIDSLWKLQKLYKAEIGEDTPTNEDSLRLIKAIEKETIIFYGAFDADKLIGCCSVTTGFSTFNYMPCGVFEDFYILPEYRHKGIARMLVRFAYSESKVSSLTVCCANCDIEMYKSLGFSLKLGNTLAFE